MTKDEMKNRISMALKDPILQQGFEIICKNLVDLEKENEELEKENTELKERHTEILEAFASASSGDDFEMAESAREIMEILNIPCYRHGKVVSKLTKAKKIIVKCLNLWKVDMTEEAVKELEIEAEQFLKEE